MNPSEKTHIARYIEEDENYWQTHFSAFDTSGLTRKSYCEEHNVNYDRFGYWKKKFLDQSSLKKEGIVRPGKLVQIAIKSEKPTNENGLCSLHLKNGCILQIHDERALALLLTKVV